MRSKFSRDRIKHHFDLISKDRPKRDEDLSQINHLLHTRLIRTYELLGTFDGLKFLDIGCGTGLAANYILENRGSYFGIDLSKQMLQEFHGTSKEEGATRLSVAIMENLPFSNASFDKVLCLGILEYVEDLELAIGELSRVMRNDSSVILSMQNKFSIYRLWDRYFYSGFLFNALRKLWGRSVVEEPLENVSTLKEPKRHPFPPSPDRQRSYLLQF